MRKYFFLLTMLGCSSPESVSGPQYLPLRTDSVVTPAPVVPKNNPVAAVRDASWAEKGPVGFFFNLDTGWGLATEDTTAFRYGWKSQKFVVNPGDCVSTDCSRTPVYERKEYGEHDEGLAKEGDEYWYGWSFYVPYESSNPWVYFGQFIQPPSDPNGIHEMIWGFLKRNGYPFCMKFNTSTHNPSTHDCGGGGIILLSDAEFEGRWHDIVIHSLWSETQGFTEVWVNDVWKGKYVGRNINPGRKGVIMKYGIYRTATFEPTIAYFDEMRKGKTRKEVDIRLLTAP
jgi:hypothetical protein